MLALPQQAIVCQISAGRLRDVDPEELQVVKALLKGAGMLPERIANMHIRASTTANLSRVYRLEESRGVSYLKIADREGARGGFFIKFLNRGDSDGREAGGLRRRHVRHLVISINNRVGRQVAPHPLCLGENVFEYRVPQALPEVSVFKDAIGCVMTRWQEVQGDHLGMLAKGAKVHDPISYSPQTVRRLANHLWEFQKLANEALIERGQTGDVECLAHEQRALLGYQALCWPLLSALGLSQEHLDTLSEKKEGLRAQAVLKAKAIQTACEEVAGTLGLSGAGTLQDIAATFLTRYPLEGAKKLNLSITSQVQGTPFQEAVFYADRDGLWSPEVLRLGRRISQLMVANEIVEDILNGGAKLTLELLKGLVELQKRYQRVEVLPKGVVHHDGHPHNFLARDGELALLDPDDISWGMAFADLSNVYVYKIVRGYVGEKLDQSQAVKLLDAALIPDWVGEHAQNILDYNVVGFWNHCRHLSECYALDPSSISGINVAVTLKSFLKELSTREHYDQVYRDTLFPLLTPRTQYA